MNCARCGNALHRLPMFDLPRKVKEFSCLCCGERFWTTQGEASVFGEKDRAAASREPTLSPPTPFSPITHTN